MSIRTTVTLDEDVLAKVKRESAARGASFRETLNDLLRFALVNLKNRPKPHPLEIKPFPMGRREGLNYDDVESLLEFAEGERHR